MSHNAAKIPTAGHINARLLAPEFEINLDELAQQWFVEVIELTIPGYGVLVADPALPGRLRGAFGNALMAGASPATLAGNPCTFDPPCAFEVLFRKQGRMKAGLDFPSPWVIGISTHHNDLVVTLSLFGFAVDWAAAAAEAFTRAARNSSTGKGQMLSFYRFCPWTPEHAET